MTEQQRTRVSEILNRNGARNDAGLIGVLQEIQKEERYLPRDILEHVAAEMEIPLTRIFSIATFYKSFSLEPRGRHQIKVCTGTACHIKGAQQNTSELKRRLGIDGGETSPDGNFSLENVNCLGTCALAPVIVVDEDYHDGITPGKIRRILKHYAKGNDQ